MIISVPQLEFDAIGFNKITLRQVAAQDLEHEFLAHNFSFGNVQPYIGNMLGDMAYPSAILRIECLASNINEMAGRIRQAITIFRLFQTAGVDIVDHRVIAPQITSQSIGSLSTNYSGLERYMWAFGLYQIDKQNSDKFIDFWRQIASKIPEGFYKSEHNATNHLTIAYQRYCDALLQKGILEARIASAVMGLEALLLPDQAEGELSFRLRTYVAKVLGLLGYDAIAVKESVKLAYKIRSSYVHGGKLSNKDEKFLVQHHSSLSKFAELILDYLRIIIIAALIIEKTKSVYTLLIDDALISESRCNELIELCVKTKALI